MMIDIMKKTSIKVIRKKNKQGKILEITITILGLC